MTVRRRQAISRVLASQMGAVARENDRSRDRGLLKCPILKADTCRECDGLMVTCQTVPEVCQTIFRAASNPLWCVELNGYHAIVARLLWDPSQGHVHIDGVYIIFAFCISDSSE
jgi:hypothetical protein